MEQLLDTSDAAKLLKVNPAWLFLDRKNPPPKIPYIKLSEKIIRYKLETLQTFLDKNEVTA